MIDGIPSANGNGYLLKGGSSFPATYADFLAAIKDGTLPIDVNFNAAGWATVGTLLSKANLLSDATAKAIGLDANGNPTPNDAFGIMASALNAPWALIKSYVTAGTYTFTVPDLFGGYDYTLGIYMIGGGGSGGAFNSQNSGYGCSCGGAAGYAKNIIITVSPGDVIPIVVGSGGASVTDSVVDSPGVNGNSGGTTSVNGNTVAGGAGGTASYGVYAAGADGGQGSDAIPRKRAAASFGGADACGSTTSSGTYYAPGKTQGVQNRFDPTMVTLAAGGAASPDNAQTGGTLPDGTKGGNGVRGTPGGSATGNGNGGGGAWQYSSPTTSGAGSAGAVFIYARRAVA